MTNVETTQDQEKATPSVERYMEFVKANDVEGAQTYLVEFFGSDGTKDPEGLEEFSKAVLMASEKAKKEELEACKVAQATEVPEAKEEVKEVVEAVVAAEASETTES